MSTTEVKLTVAFLVVLFVAFIIIKKHIDNQEKKYWERFENKFSYKKKE